jgi:very-short-patch-repair endonuclease
MARIYNRTDQKNKRRELRNNIPRAEVILWSKLRGKQLLGYKFRRQYSIGSYVVDFYCPGLRLAIEVDGDSHFGDGVEARDQRRQAYIESCGIRVLRFTNDDIYKNLYGVLSKIAEVMGL